MPTEIGTPGAGDLAEGTRAGGPPEAGSTISLLAASEVEGDAGLRREWEQLAVNSRNLYAFYQSPAWWDYSMHTAVPDYVLHLEEGQRPVLACIRAADGSLVGAVGVQQCRFPLAISFRTHKLCRLPGRVLKILGGQPLLCEDEELYAELIGSLLAAHPDCDCLYLRSVPLGGCFWNSLHGSPKVREQVSCYFPAGVAVHCRLTLPPTFSDYLQHFQSGSRKNLQ
jgi:hypothetical protein